jgi:hypothetical protein
MGSRENFNISISNIGGNYAVELENGEICEFFLQSPNNFLGKFFASDGINYNYSFPGSRAPVQTSHGVSCGMIIRASIRTELATKCDL